MIENLIIPFVGLLIMIASVTYDIRTGANTRPTVVTATAIGMLVAAVGLAFGVGFAILLVLAFVVIEGCALFFGTPSIIRFFRYIFR